MVFILSECFSVVENAPNWLLALYQRLLYAAVGGRARFYDADLGANILQQGTSTSTALPFWPLFATFDADSVFPLY